MLTIRCQLRSNLHFFFQMEQSREVYETATNQLGSFLELVSNRLTLKGPDTPLPLSVLSDGQRHQNSGAQGHVSYASSLSHGSRGGSGVRKRSESENNRRKSTASNLTPGRGRDRQGGSRYLLEDPSLSPAISCTSSSLNTSSASDRSSGIGSGPRRTSELIRFSRSQERKSGSEIGSGVTNNDEGAYDISILSSCTCPEDEELPDKAEDRRKTSKTRNTLKRITSFMRKDKSKNLSLVDSGAASLKYSRYIVSTGSPDTMAQCALLHLQLLPCANDHKNRFSANTSPTRPHLSTLLGSGEFGL